jgi:hypothetical protein
MKINLKWKQFEKGIYKAINIDDDGGGNLGIVYIISG